ncbi:DUF4279 domain-containing protein [Brevundimonas sp.]|uniref:DUF4279 domain-containing protein n=1 Tax=Brevundimonas sp. TaxID=1871086 RepID=UPI00273023B6|nr:DUF4279 domain-containing protein [Brevundimonas sp.]MDP1911755.1 DUF4279 domain-containing protein [Brevundimonas sp.]
MGGIGRTKVSLRFAGEDLDPEVVSHALGLQPDKSYRKGEIASWGRFKGRAAESGSWHLSVPVSEPGDLEAQITDLLARATSDVSAWRNMADSYSGNLFCGLFMKTMNEGLSLSATTMGALGARGIELQLDIYDSSRD